MNRTLFTRLARPASAAALASVLVAAPFATIVAVAEPGEPLDAVAESVVELVELGETLDALPLDVLPVASIQPDTGAAEQADDDPATVGDIAGTVTDLAGAPIANAIVWIRDPQTTNIVRTAITDAAGQYAVAGLAAGDYLVHFFAEDYASEFFDDVPTSGAAATVTLVAGETFTADAALLAVNNLRGWVRWNDGTTPTGYRVHVARLDDGSVWNLPLDANGFFPSVDYRGGDYTLAVVDAGGQVVGYYDGDQNLADAPVPFTLAEVRAEPTVVQILLPLPANEDDCEPTPPGPAGLVIVDDRCEEPELPTEPECVNPLTGRAEDCDEPELPTYPDRDPQWPSHDLETLASTGAPVAPFAAAAVVLLALGVGVRSIAVRRQSTD